MNTAPHLAWKLLLFSQNENPLSVYVCQFLPSYSQWDCFDGIGPWKRMKSAQGAVVKRPGFSGAEKLECALSSPERDSPVDP